MGAIDQKKCEIIEIWGPKKEWLKTRKPLPDGDFGQNREKP
jgi:hypothetical protein